MGNLRAAALACGVVASCLAGGIGISYASSSQVSSAKVVEDNETGNINPDDAITTTANSESEETTENTTKTVSITKNAAYTAAAKKGAYYNNANASAKTAVTTTTVVTTTVTATVTTTAAVVTEPVTEPVTEAPVYEEPEVYEEVYEEPVVEEVYVEPVTEASTYVEPVTNAATSEMSQYALPISDEDFILLCNAVAHEAGSCWISETDKAKIVEVIMNRVSSPIYPDTIYGVLTQRNQFSGASSYVNLGTFSSAVTESVKSAVLLYFADPSQFNDGYLSFYGNGSQNIFY